MRKAREVRAGNVPARETDPSITACICGEAAGVAVNMVPAAILVGAYGEVGIRSTWTEASSAVADTARRGDSALNVPAIIADPSPIDLRGTGRDMNAAFASAWNSAGDPWKGGSPRRITDVARWYPSFTKPECSAR